MLVGACKAHNTTLGELAGDLETFLWGKWWPFLTDKREGARGGDAREHFLGHKQCFFDARGSKKGLGPSPSRTSRRNINITHFPLAMEQREGNSACMHCTRCV